MLLWYTYEKMSREDNIELNKLLVEHLEENGEEVVETYADCMRNKVTPGLIKELTLILLKKLTAKIKKKVEKEAKQEMHEKLRQEFE